MSRGFVKEEDQEEPPFIPPRAALPVGVTNYVTPKGFELLKEERKVLEAERQNIIIQDETERRRALAVIDGKLQQLSARIASARIINASSAEKDIVRFGALVHFRNLETKKEEEFQVVGVDEANIELKKIAFVAPIAKALMGKKLGATFTFYLGKNPQRLKILGITYN